MRNTTRKGLPVLILVTFFIGGTLIPGLTLASCDLSDNDSNDSGGDIDTVYTIIFDANGGSGAVPNSKSVYPGYSLTIPDGSGLSKSGFAFGGWNTNSSGSGINYPVGSSLTPTASIILYAKWNIGTSTVTDPDDELNYIWGLANKLEWLQENVQRGGKYTIELSANETTGLLDLSFGNRTNITITIRSVGSNRTINLSSNNNMFNVGRGVNLVLDNITLRGRGGNTYPLIYISGGTLTMNNGSAITGNSCRGVEVADGGSFTMNGGTISGNTFSNAGGGGVAVWNGSFTMNAGTISGNSAGWGGGVLVNNGSFTMNAGTISGNVANDYGGGVVVFSGVFTKIGGIITGYATDPSNGNRTMKGQLGHAVYAYGNSGVYKYKDQTIGPGDNLSYNGSTGSFGGVWDY